ncbi:MAG: hypothetical protein JO020_33295 [Chloroflexi bacterium]|nr:hypothetical protein [Chloroflexota bacterium]MBV9133634.1 hypothetical protein [Chloroflexota bacterium]MBV9899059.1 hypothetical protein [Chloroflexota bacterium]
MSRLACSAVLSVLLAVAQPALAQEQTDEPLVRQSVESVLEMDTFRGVDRLPRITLDAERGDLTIVFAMRRPMSDDPHQIVASATDDVFTILWATYTSGDAARIRSATVLGTYAVVGRYERPKEVPLLRAVLSADRAANFDWASAYRLDPRLALDTWWVEGELTTATP